LWSGDLEAGNRQETRRSRIWRKQIFVKWDMQNKEKECIAGGVGSQACGLLQGGNGHGYESSDLLHKGPAHEQAINEEGDKDAAGCQSTAQGHGNYQGWKICLLTNTRNPPTCIV
jgi:hypothetical protein